MAAKPETIRIKSITGTTLFADGTIALDILDHDDNVRIVEFKPETQGHLYQCLLPRGSSITGSQPRGFAAEQAELLQTPSGSFAIQFLLSGGLSIAIGLPPALLLGLRDLLNTIEEQSLH